MPNKKQLGQFFTKGKWLNPAIANLIKPYIGDKGVLDPFAGGGDLNTFNVPFTGYDIDPKLNWPINDSLKSIPSFKGLIVTNPPYLAKNSASRQGLSFPANANYDDLYKIGLSNCIDAAPQVVAIVPASCYVSGEFPDFSFIDFLEESPFEDTEYPVCVIGFGFKGCYNYLYKNGKQFYVPPNSEMKYKGTVEVLINKPGGQYTFKCIDGNSSTDRIRVLPLDTSRSVKATDRAYCCITTPKPLNLEKINKEIEEYRAITQDIYLKPFKGTNEDGVYRRCITQNVAKGIVENHVQRLL